MQNVTDRAEQWLEMKKYKVLVVGAGSAGLIHIENLIALGMEVSVFRYRDKLKKELSRQSVQKIYDSIEDALNEKHDAIVIANRTDQHIATAISGAKNGAHLFIEKPLSNKLDGIQELTKIISQRRLTVEIGCMMRFHPGIKQMKQMLSEGAIGTPYLARSCVGQFLPEWRPRQDYRESYSAKPAYGGGVLFDLIHELDYLYWLFGDVLDVSAFTDRISDLKIETEDVANILLRFKNRISAQIQLDYLSPFYRRTCEIVGSEGIITWDYMTGEVTLRHKSESELSIIRQPESFKRNTMFVDHMKHFLGVIQNGGMPAVSLENGIQVLKIALAAHRSSKDRLVVRPSDICNN